MSSLEEIGSASQYPTTSEPREDANDQGRRLLLIVQSFVATQDITCSETIYQTDRVIENAYEFIERLCDVVGYAERDDD